MQELNLNLLARVLAQPWAIQQERLAVMTQMVISPFANREEHALRAAALAKQETRGLSLRERVIGSAQGTHVIPIWGTIGRGWEEWEKAYLGAVDVDDVMMQIDALPAGSPLVLWFRSPGGISTGVPEFAEYLRVQGAARKIVAFTDDLCCSAAYWLAAQCEEIHATPTADVGSIGVYVAWYDWTEYLAKIGVKLELSKAGRMKGMLMPGNPVSDEERAHIETRVQECYAAFTGDVLRNREIGSETMQGQTYYGKAAKERNLVDGFAPSAAAFFGGR